ncbi:MAG: sulfatase-like hydrolase/transferase [Gammaproteobacteria bacterium]|nr:sulfatase-like hydrolase/transferase [Gammaproteobacteria bacterium]
MSKSALASVRDNSHQFYKFIFYSFAFSLLLFGAFLLNAGAPQSFIGFAYSLTIPVYYYLVLLLLSLVLLPVAWFKPLLPLIILPKVIADVLLVADYFVFGVYRFHIDMMLINMMLYDFKGVGVSFSLVFIAMLSASLVAAVNVLIFVKRDKLPSFSLLKANALVFVLFIVSQLIHVVGYEYKQVAITKYTPYFPYYAPLTSSSLMAKLKTQFPSVFPEKSEADGEDIADILSSTQQGLLSYPKAPLQCASKSFGEASEPLKRAPNILLFVMESWRQGDMGPEITPHIYEFSQKATRYNNHYSGGSVTVNGLYSLLTGLHPTYRDYMTASPYKNQSLLTKTFAELGYDIDVYTSSNLDRFSLKAMMFGKIADEHYVNPMSEAMEVNDAKAVDALLADLKTPSDKPWFKFVFLSSSHHSYTYPDEHKIFTPIESNPEAFLFDKQMDETGIFNDYKNSVNYLDHLFGQIWQQLKESNLTGNLMTVVTSDHGEEFNDNRAGYWGHGSNFTTYQTAVPFYLQQPNQTQGADVNSLSGHVDYVPTVLASIAKCNNPVTDYSSGFNLMELPQQRVGLIISSYKEKAYLIDDKVYATGLSIDSYHVGDLKQKNQNFDYRSLNELKQQETAFLK